jgi:hypothetical protein
VVVAAGFAGEAVFAAVATAAGVTGLAAGAPLSERAGLAGLFAGLATAFTGAAVSTVLSAAARMPAFGFEDARALADPAGTVAAALVFAAVFAVLAADFLGAAAAVARAFAADSSATPDALLVTETFDGEIFVAAVFAARVLVAALLAGEVLDAAWVAWPLERRDAATALVPFDFSFFLADGIRGALLLRPAVETGRITDRPTPGSFRSRQAGLWF